MKKYLKSFFVMFCLLASFQVFAQERTIIGKVIDEKGETLPGVTVFNETLQKGAITDNNGGFSISAQTDDDVLIFSFIGFETQKMVVQGRAEINITLKQDLVGLEEVVVVGYGSVKKSDLTGSVSSVSTDDLDGSVISNVDQMLQGRVAGVQMTQNSGAPGGAASIRIRGASSINNSNEPLYVIDGIPFNGDGTDIGGFAWSGGSNGQTKVNPLSTIAPSDIVSMDILKDASATAIYGAAGANGVVIIQTRRGEKGDIKLNYEGYVAAQELVKQIDVMDLQEFAQYQKEIGETNQLDVDDAFLDPSILGEGTNWQDEIFRTAPVHSHQLSLTAGGEKLQMAASAGYMSQEGILFGSGFERYNSRINVDGEVKKWLKMGGSIAVTHTDETITRNDGSDGVIMQSLTMSPAVPVYNFDGTWAGPGDVNGASRYNPVWLAEMQNNTLTRNRAMGNMYLSIDPIKDLNLRSEFGYDIGNNKNQSFIPTYDFGLISSDLNKMMYREEHSLYWIWKNYATYNLKINKHSFNLMGGVETSKSAWDGIQIIKQGFSTDDIFVMTTDGEFVSNDGWKDAATTASVFGRLNYNYDNRYLLTSTMRADASSKFGKDNKWGYFPSVALAWRISEEAFLEDVDLISNFKLRFGFGMVGNSNIGTYKYGSAMYTMSTPLGTAYRLENVSNPNLKWEASEQFNLGVDFGIIQDRITLTVDLYQKTTNDLLMQVSIPSYLGDENSYNGIAAPFANVGQTKNNGIELALNTVNYAREDFQWNTNMVFTVNKNEVVALNDDSQVIYGNLDWWSEFQTATAIMVGQPMGVYYGYQTDGLFTSEEDILNSAVQVEDPSNPGVNLYNQKTGVYVGDIKFKDINNDGVIDDKDQSVIGDPNPDFTFGFYNTFMYKNFDLAIGIHGSYGGDILNFTRYKTESMTSIWDNQSTAVIDRAQFGYTEAGDAYLLNPDAELPRAATNDFNRNTRMSDRWIEDGSYLRVSNITLGYKLPESILKHIGIASFKVYGTVQNAFTWTNYSGYDPEIGAYNQNVLYQGVDMGRYPSPRTYTFGINVGF
jgi:TonB-linked SusC/RagA family outer membrane protein